MSCYRGRQSRCNNWLNAELRNCPFFVERTVFVSQLTVKDRQTIGPSQNGLDVSGCIAAKLARWEENDWHRAIEVID